MVEFASAVEAVRSAVELQRGMVERNIGTPAERRQSLPHRPAPGRHHRVGRGRVRRHGQPRGAPAGAGGRRARSCCRPRSTSRCATSSLCRSARRARATLEEHRPADADLFPRRPPVRHGAGTARRASSADMPGSDWRGDRTGRGRRRRLSQRPPVVDGGGRRGERATVDRERPVGRRAAVRQPERRCGPGLFLRRPDRRHHARARALQGTHGDRLWRGAAVPQQGAAADGDRPCAQRALPRGRQRSPAGPEGPGHRPAHRRGQRHPAVVRAVRRRAQRHLRRPGAHRPPCRRHAGDQPAADRPAAEPAKPTNNLDGLRPGAAGAGAGRRGDALGQSHGARAAAEAS